MAHKYLPEETEPENLCVDADTDFRCVEEGRRLVLGVGLANGFILVSSTTLPLLPLCPPSELLHTQSKNKPIQRRKKVKNQHEK